MKTKIMLVVKTLRSFENLGHYFEMDDYDKKMPLESSRLHFLWKSTRFGKVRRRDFALNI